MKRKLKFEDYKIYLGATNPEKEKTQPEKKT